MPACSGASMVSSCVSVPPGCTVGSLSNGFRSSSSSRCAFAPDGEVSTLTTRANSSPLQANWPVFSMRNSTFPFFPTTRVGTLNCVTRES